MPASRAASASPSAAEGGPVEDQPADDGDRGEHQDQRRDAEHVGVALTEVEDAVDGDDLRPPVGDLQGETAGGGEHGEGGDERDHPAVCDEHPVDQPAAQSDEDGGEEDAAEAVLLGGDGGGPHRGEGDDRADRQVDAAGDDDEGHADGDDPDDGGLGEDELQVAGVQELVRFGDAADEDQCGEHAEQ